MKPFAMILFSLFLCFNVFAEDVKPLAIGQSAPEFRLPGIDGREYTLADFKDAKLLVMIFTANHCPTAQAYEDRVNKLVDDFSDKGVAFVAISSNHPKAVCLEELGYSDLGDTFEDMKIRAKEKGFKYPYLYDGDTQEVALAYGPQATPHVFIFDQSWKLRYRGRIDEMESPYETPEQQDTRNAIEVLLAGKEPAVTTTKVFGCSMKWLSKVAWRKTLDTRWNERAITLEPIGKEGVRDLIANQSDKIRLINVYATWCGPCVIEFPELVTIQRMYENRNVEVISLSADKISTKDKVVKFLEDNEAGFTNYLYDSEDKYALIEAVDASWEGALPHTLLIAPGGRVLYRHTGIIDPLEVKQKIIKEIGRFFADDK